VKYLFNHASEEAELSDTEGFFAETQEQLAGFFLISAWDRQNAIQVARNFCKRAWRALRCDRSASWPDQGETR
jgi:hypothetical protein